MVVAIAYAPARGTLRSARGGTPARAPRLSGFPAPPQEGRRRAGGRLASEREHRASHQGTGGEQKTPATVQRQQQYSARAVFGPNKAPPPNKAPWPNKAFSNGPSQTGPRHLVLVRSRLEARPACATSFGMNGGAGRIPSGFCTLTCSVHKWSQLHGTL